VSPTNAIPGVRLVDGARVASSYLWGFLPPNAPSRAFVSQYFSFNARSDRLSGSRLYSKAFLHQRCLIPVSAWFEWPKAPGAKKGTPCTILPANGELFVFAGLWGAWEDPATGIVQATATGATGEPNDLIAELPHHRMPAILPASEWDVWLDPEQPVEVLKGLLHPCPSRWLEVAPGGPTNLIC